MKNGRVGRRVHGRRGEQEDGIKEESSKKIGEGEEGWGSGGLHSRRDRRRFFKEEWLGRGGVWEGGVPLFSFPRASIGNPTASGLSHLLLDSPLSESLRVGSRAMKELGNGRAGREGRGVREHDGERIFEEDWRRWKGGRYGREENARAFKKS